MIEIPLGSAGTYWYVEFAIQTSERVMLMTIIISSAPLATEHYADKAK